MSSRPIHGEVSSPGAYIWRSAGTACAGAPVHAAPPDRLPMGVDGLRGRLDHANDALEELLPTVPLAQNRRVLSLTPSG